MKTSWIKWPFILSGVYDLILGLLFLAIGMKLYDACGITRPNHPGYIQFPACMLMLFGLMFFQIAKNPFKNRILIPYGIALKISYCSVVFFYALKQQIPQIWVWFAWCDLIFLILFIVAWKKTSTS